MWSDKETLYDCLGYTSYVEVLADVCVRPDLAPLTLGIFGAWGSGKTSLLSMLKRRLDQGSKDAKIRTLWFNAWKYEGRDEAQSALIHAILGKLTEGQTLVGEAKEAFERLIKGTSVLKLAKFITKTAVTLTPDLGGFLDCFKEQSKDVAETMERFESDFGNLLEKVDVGQIVVFIDDLDRCPSTKVIETFETIKLFLNTPRCTFVIGADSERIQQAIGDVYNVSDVRRTKDYLEKIVQLPFNIPVQKLQDIACYVGMLVVGRHLVSDEEWDSFATCRPQLYQAGPKLCETLNEWVRTNGKLLRESHTTIGAELDGLLPYVPILRDGLRGNPRQIKRFLNILSLRRQLAMANNLKVDDALLVKMAVLEYVWEEFFNALVETVDPSTGCSPLIEELVAEATEAEKEKSQLVEGFAEQARLVTFLKNEPQFTGTTDLGPYLYLAQTSLSRGTQQQLLPPDEKARNLAKSIGGNDRVVSKAAALRAAAEESGIAESVIRYLLPILANSQDNQILTHTLNGLDTICTKHPRLYEDAVKAMEQCDPRKNQAVGVAGNNLLANAKRAGANVPTTLASKYTDAAGALSALTVTNTSRPRR